MLLDDVEHAWNPTLCVMACVGDSGAPANEPV
jgi:hypothetical protein